MSVGGAESAFPASTFLPGIGSGTGSGSPASEGPRRPFGGRDDAGPTPGAVGADRLGAAADLSRTVLSFAFPAPARLDLSRLDPDELLVATLFVSPTGERLPTESLIRRLEDGVEVITTVSTPEGFAVTLQAEERRREEGVQDLVRLVAGPPSAPPPRLGLSAFRAGLVLGPGVEA